MAASLKEEFKTTDTVDIEADKLDIYRDKQEAVFYQNVKAKKGDMTLTCQKLQMIYNATTEKVDQLIASEEVLITWQEKQATCDQANYILAEEKIFLTGNVIITRGEEKMSAQAVTIDMKTGSQVAEGKEGKVKIRIKTEQGIDTLKWNR
jgi:lipopolysaccharide export system protein LptA